MLRGLLLAGLLAAAPGACGPSHAPHGPVPTTATPVVGATGSATSPAGSATAPAGSAADAAALCTSTGGSIGNASCCGAVGDFPDMTGVGACGCALTNSHTVQVCDCPAGKRFSATAGCR